MVDAQDLRRIEHALSAAAELLERFDPRRVAVERKSGGDPVTEADRAVDTLLRDMLPCPGDGWLSEETRDDPEPRLASRRVWVVDPLDGTRQFLAGIPEWCVSIALVVDRVPVAGGTLNPATRESFVGSLAGGVRRNGAKVSVSRAARLEGALVLASRSEWERGEWERYRHAPFTVRATGSIAYKLSLVASGLADATFSFVSKNEWDVAAGIALVLSAGGVVQTLDGSRIEFNKARPEVPGLLVANPALAPALARFLSAA